MIPIENKQNILKISIESKQKILIPCESNNQIDLGKHNSYQYRYQFKHDINIKNVSIYQSKVFFIIKNVSKISTEMNSIERYQYER